MQYGCFKKNKLSFIHFTNTGVLSVYMQNLDEFDKIFRIGDLVVKYINEELNEPEQSELNKWLESSDSNRELFNQLINSAHQKQAAEFFTNDKKEAWTNIYGQVKSQRISDYKLFKYAAVLAFVLFSAWMATKYDFFAKISTKNDPVIAKVQKQEIIQPGGNKAVLTLYNGEQIELDSLENGTVAEQFGNTVSKTEEGKLVYNFSSGSAKNEQAFNTISTPKGGEYQLILPDGTKVWLNSMSSLKFPVTFNSRERAVELIGEAYFEVAKDKSRPFRVYTKDTKVEVLGTHFNISAFADDSSVRTSLLEGAVKVEKGQKSVTLKPGQEALSFDSKDGIITQEADLEKVMAWKNGYFLFRDEPIESLMQRISRWYNVDVYYQGNVTGETFGGKFSKKSSLSELLKSLELTGTIKFKTQERRITVMQ